MAVIFFDFVVVGHAGAGKTNKLPTNHADVAAVHGIAEHALDGVLAKKREKGSGLDLVQGFVLLRRREKVKAFQSLQAIAINLARSLLALIAELGGSVFERRLCVAITVAAVRAGELVVNADGDASFARSGAGIVGGKNARSGSGDDEGFGFGEEAEWNADGFALGGEEGGFAVERINEDSAESCG